MLRSYLCDYSEAYIAVKETTDLLAAAPNENGKSLKNIAFKNNAPFRLCISKMNSTFLDDAEDLDIVMPMYNLSDYIPWQTMTLGSYDIMELLYRRNWWCWW